MARAAPDWLEPGETWLTSLRLRWVPHLVASPTRRGLPSPRHISRDGCLTHRGSAKVARTARAQVTHRLTYERRGWRAFATLPTARAEKERPQTGSLALNMARPAPDWRRWRSLQASALSVRGIRGGLAWDMAPLAFRRLDPTISQQQHGGRRRRRRGRRGGRPQTRARALGGGRRAGGRYTRAAARTMQT